MGAPHSRAPWVHIHMSVGPPSPWTIGLAVRADRAAATKTITTNRNFPDPSPKGFCNQTLEVSRPARFLLFLQNSGFSGRVRLRK